MNIDSGELWKLRRFALGTGTVLLTWSLAGVTFAPGTTITPLGLPLAVARPDLIPFGLALSAVYGALRYFYYALSFGPSPYRVRRDLLDQLRYAEPGRMGPYSTPHMYFGAIEFTSTPWWSDREKAERLASELRKAFPKFAMARVEAAIESDRSIDEDGDEYLAFAVKVSIPVRCRIAAAVEDLDYSAPFWFPLLSVVFWLVRIP